jgi:cytidyltransferase-like protein
VIVTAEHFPELYGNVTMVGGGYDPLHAGHVRYFEAAAAFGLPVLVSIDPEPYVESKHPVLLPVAERAEVIDALKPVTYVHLAPGSQQDVLALLRPRYFVKGADWRGRLPEEEVAAAADAGCEIVYCDTVFNSSSALLADYVRRHLAREAGRRGGSG